MSFSWTEIDIILTTKMCSNACLTLCLPKEGKDQLAQPTVCCTHTMHPLTWLFQRWTNCTLALLSVVAACSQLVHCWNNQSNGRWMVQPIKSHPKAVVLATTLLRWKPSFLQHTSQYLSSYMSRTVAKNLELSRTLQPVQLTSSCCINQCFSKLEIVESQDKSTLDFLLICQSNFESAIHQWSVASWYIRYCGLHGQDIRNWRNTSMLQIYTQTVWFFQYVPDLFEENTTRQALQSQLQTFPC